MTHPGPTEPPVGKDPAHARGWSHDREDRLHVSALLVGLIDARASHVDFFDTQGGWELQRWYRRHHPHRPA